MALPGQGSCSHGTGDTWHGLRGVQGGAGLTGRVLRHRCLAQQDLSTSGQPGFALPIA